MRPPLPSHLLSRTRTTTTTTTTTLRSSTPSRIRPRRNNHTSSTSPEPPNKTTPNPTSNKTTPPPPDAGTPATTPSPSTAAPPSPATIPAGSGSRRTLRQVIVQGPLGNLGRAYSRVQARRPYATQLWSSVIVYLCGDLSAQYFFPPGGGKPVRQTGQEGGDGEGREGEGEGQGEGEGGGGGGGYDPWRTLRHLTVGATSSIPSYNWFMFLHHNFNFASKFLSILTKVCVQQAVFTPVFNTYFFSVHSLLSGASLEETWERLKKALPVSIVNSCKLWPGVTAFSFMYVAPQFRNIFSGCIAVGWQTYLSWLNQKAAREVEAAEVAAELASTSSPSPVEASIVLKA